MILKNPVNKIRTGILVILSFVLASESVNAQKIRFGLFAEPVISWFSTDTKETKNDGSRAGFNFGFTFNKYFSKNYSFSTGISLLSAGGRLVNPDSTIEMRFNNFNTEVIKGNPVVYRIQYLFIP